MTQPPPPSSGPLSPQHGAYGAGGVPSPGAPSPYGYAQPPAKKPSKAPKILITLGAIILGLSIIIGVVLAIIGFTGAAKSITELEVLDSGSGTITAEEGESLQIYAEEGAPTPNCTVDGPAVGDGTFQSSTVDTDGTSWVSVDSFTAEQAGDYEVSCDDGPVAVGPPVSIGGIFAGLGGILLAVFGGALGILLLLIGVIVLIVRKRSA